MDTGNIADPDQTLQNVSSDQYLHCLLSELYSILYICILFNNPKIRNGLRYLIDMNGKLIHLKWVLLGNICDVHAFS